VPWGGSPSLGKPYCLYLKSSITVTTGFAAILLNQYGTTDAVVTALPLTSVQLLNATSVGNSYLGLATAAGQFSVYRPIALGVRWRASVATTVAPGVTFVGLSSASSLNTMTALSTSAFETLAQTRLEEVFSGSVTWRPKDNSENTAGNFGLSVNSDTTVAEIPFVVFTGVPNPCTIFYEAIFQCEGFIGPGQTSIFPNMTGDDSGVFVDASTALMKASRMAGDCVNTSDGFNSPGLISKFGRSRASNGLLSVRMRKAELEIKERHVGLPAASGYYDQAVEMATHVGGQLINSAVGGAAVTAAVAAVGMLGNRAHEQDWVGVNAPLGPRLLGG